MTLLFVVVMGIVEGLTEFLPVSSTGHLILTANAFGLGGTPKIETFEIFIQLGAILAVAWEYRIDLWRLTARLRFDRNAWMFVLKLFLAFLPAAIVGLATREMIHAHLFNVGSVASALIVGGIFMFAVEQFTPKWTPEPVERISWLQALGVGLFQCLALWPGFSRSASTILGGMTLGLDRSRSTVFSFYLALPTMGAATVYELFKAIQKGELDSGDAGNFAIGTLVSFIVALIVIKGMLWYVRQHDFRPFAVYRILLGIVVLAVRPAMPDKKPSTEHAFRQPQIQAVAFARREM
jgi:undecaprenyl-diphosphatase